MNSTPEATLSTNDEKELVDLSTAIQRQCAGHDIGVVIGALLSCLSGALNILPARLKNTAVDGAMMLLSKHKSPNGGH